MYVRASLAVAALLIVFSICPLVGQEEDGEPPWVTYRRGLNALEDRDFGEALQQFRSALSKQRPFPEAEVGIGRVFQAEGNVQLARRQYERALSEAESFYVSQDEFAVRYRLAELYRNRQEWKEYQEMLSSVTDRDPQFASDNDPAYRRLIPDTLTRDRLEDRPPEPRLDILLTLYRLEVNFATEAHRELGEQLLSNGRYDSAVEHLSFAVVARLSLLVDELRRETYGFEFESTPALISAALDVERLAAYLGETDLFRSMFYLAGALWGQNTVSDVPAEIWRVVGRFPAAAGPWAMRAERALEAPETGTIVD